MILMQAEHIIEMLHITKEFPGIIANDDITLQLKKGEIHALLGENHLRALGVMRCVKQDQITGLGTPDGFGLIRRDDGKLCCQPLVFPHIQMNLNRITQQYGNK